MLKLIKSEDLYLANEGWLKSLFHFSFANYHNPNNMNFGVLRVLNDDLIKAKSGFDLHPHKDMEIITYIIDGELTHKDSMGNSEKLTRGEVQYMSAGTGVYHSEHNLGSSQLRLLQLWIYPPQKSLPTLYGSKKYRYEDRKNKLLNIVSSKNGNADIKIYQDINIYVSELDADKEIEFCLNDNRQIYFILIEGELKVNNKILNSRDAMEIINEKNIIFSSFKRSHFLFVEMQKV